MTDDRPPDFVTEVIVRHAIPGGVKIIVKRSHDADAEIELNPVEWQAAMEASAELWDEMENAPADQTFFAAKRTIRAWKATTPGWKAQEVR